MRHTWNFVDSWDNPLCIKCGCRFQTLEDTHKCRPSFVTVGTVIKMRSGKLAIDPKETS